MNLIKKVLEISKREKVLITGGSGLFAVNCAAALIERMDVVLGFHKKKIELTGINGVSIDLESLDNLRNSISKIKPTLIIHTVALTSVETCEANPFLAEYVNINLAANVALVTKENSIRFVFISTDQLFDGQKPIYSELDEANPINVYGRTKAKAEKEVLSVNENTLVIRTNFFGWGTSYRSSFSDLIISSLRNNKPVFLFNDVFYTPILVQTLVECIEKLININQKGLFNIVGDEKLSKYDFGMEVAEFFELNHKLIHSVSIMERRDLVVRPHNMSLSNHKVTSMTDISIGGIKSQLILMKKQLEFKIYKEIQFL